MNQEKSLDRIKKTLSISKLTAFDWRHKILAALCETVKNDFSDLNWYRVKEHLKESAQLTKDIALNTTENVKVGFKFRQIQKEFANLNIITNMD